MPITLTFCGAAQTVTGSRYLLQTNQATILIDAGMFQDRDLLGLNWENYRINPTKLDAVLLTHGHLDHCGWLPKLVKDGFKGPVFATAATADLVPIIVRDAAHIQEEDAKTKAKRHAKEGRTDTRPPVPLYTAEEADKAVAMLRPIEKLDQPQEIAPGITATWNENGHILGASWIGLETEGKRLTFSGDIGRWDRPILNDPLPPHHTDYLIIESTYGNRNHATGDTENELREILTLAHKRGGNLLIPSFSVERAQELLYILSHLGEKGQLPFNAVYLDSPMAAKVTGLFRRHPEVCDEDMLALLRAGKSPFAFAGLQYTTSADESKKLNDIKSGAIIIAGNGMCTGGRIKHHLLNHLENPHSTLLFVGYQARGTLGRQLLEGAKEIRLFNMKIPVKMSIAQLNGLSGHADRNELLRWTDSIAEPPKRCFVTHGDRDAAIAFAASLRDNHKWNAHTPAMWEKADL